MGPWEWVWDDNGTMVVGPWQWVHGNGSVVMGTWQHWVWDGDGSFMANPKQEMVLEKGEWFTRI